MALQKLKACLATRTSLSAGLAVPVVVIGVVALFAWSQQDERPVSAFAVNLPDADDDGLRDEFEKSMFTGMNAWDSDGDTWSDAEEFSMNSNPNDSLAFPTVIPRLSTNLTARGENGRLHVLSAAYFMDAQNVSGAHFELGVLIGRRYRKFSSDYVAVHGESHSVAARPIGSKVAFFEMSFPETLVPRGGRATFLAMLTMPGDIKPSAIARLDVLKDSGSGVLVVEYSSKLMPYDPVTQTPIPSGSVYIPIPTNSSGPTGVVPLTWAPSKLCFKQTATVGRAGALLIQEVTAARCIDGFEGFCSPPICFNTVGEQYQTIDPLALVGAQ